MRRFNSLWLPSQDLHIVQINDDPYSSFPEKTPRASGACMCTLRLRTARRAKIHTTRVSLMKGDLPYTPNEHHQHVKQFCHLLVITWGYVSGFHFSTASNKMLIGDWRLSPPHCSFVDTWCATCIAINSFMKVTRIIICGWWEMCQPDDCEILSCLLLVCWLLQVGVWVHCVCQDQAVSDYI